MDRQGSQYEQPTDERSFSLSRADGEAVDAALRARGGGDADGQVSADASRVRRVEALLGLLDQYPLQEPSADLTRRTLNRIERQRSHLRLADAVDRGEPAAIAFRWRELVAVAAVLMIAVSLGWPLLNSAKEEARRVACRDHQKAVHAGLAGFAQDNEGRMPRYTVKPGNYWNRTGTRFNPHDGSVQSNSANAYILVRRELISAQDLSCPGNPHSARHLSEKAWDFPNVFASGYSYQNQFTAEPQRLDDVPRKAVLADRNPWVRFRVNGREIVVRVLGDGPNQWHGKAGQNVLRADGSASWLDEPILDETGDHFYMPGDSPSQRLQHNEIPVSAGDSMLVQ